MRYLKFMYHLIFARASTPEATPEFNPRLKGVSPQELSYQLNIEALWN